jgi:hypothetical protein
MNIVVQTLLSHLGVQIASQMNVTERFVRACFVCVAGRTHNVSHRSSTALSIRKSAVEWRNQNGALWTTPAFA